MATEQAKFLSALSGGIAGLSGQCNVVDTNTVSATPGRFIVPVSSSEGSLPVRNSIESFLVAWHNDFYYCWISFGSHPLKLERYRED